MLSRTVVETRNPLVSGCSKLAQKEYKKRHDNVARAIHWDLSGKCGFNRNDKWYNPVPESVLENENYKLLWDFSIRADRHIEARRLDLKCHYDQNLDIHFFTISYTIGLS